MELERKFCTFDAAVTVNDGCLIEGYASRFGQCDQGNDVVASGAYRASLKRLSDAGRGVKMLWQHDPAQPIGVWDEVGEDDTRSEEHTSELQSPVPISYAVFCLKKKNHP